jgi:hypothetical protein
VDLAGLEMGLLSAVVPVGCLHYFSWKQIFSANGDSLGICCSDYTLYL